MANNNPGAPSGHRACPTFSVEALWQRQEEFRQANKPKTPDFEMTPYGPDRNVIWTTYNAFLNGEISFPLPRGFWPDRALYEPTFIGPLPPRNKWWIPWDTRDHKSGLWFITNYMIVPDAAQVNDWFKSNIKTRVQLYYRWFEKGRRKSFISKLYSYGPNEDAKTNHRFLKMVKTSFAWLERGEAFSVAFDFDDINEGGAFKRHHPWRYKEP